MKKPALEGGRPVRETYLPYGRHTIGPGDRRAVNRVLMSDFVTQGPLVERFENAFAERVGAKYAVALSSGTAALHAAAASLRLRPGDRVIVPPITFAATSNAVLYCGAQPVFVDVEPDTGRIDADRMADAIDKRTRAVFPVHYAGHPCGMAAIRAVCRDKRVPVVVDAAHALGAMEGGKPVGSRDAMNVFSTHPVKHITTGEGGAVTTNRKPVRDFIARFRSHGIARRSSPNEGEWHYAMEDLGYNYRLTDIGSALGLSQLDNLDRFLARRRKLARRYDDLLGERDDLDLIAEPAGCESAYHIYPVLIRTERIRVGKKRLFAALRAENIGVQVHYIPVYLHPYYRTRLGTGPGLCPHAERFFERVVTLPLFPSMTRADQDDVVAALDRVLTYYRR